MCARPRRLDGHNHQQEFETTHEDPADGETKTVWQILVENTDPDFVGFQLDTYGAAYGGADNVELLDEYGDRIPMLHVKDGTVDSDDPSITQLGEGDLDFIEIFEAAWPHVDYYAYEYDRAPEAFDKASGAFTFMSCLEFDREQPVPPVGDICAELDAAAGLRRRGGDHARRLDPLPGRAQHRARLGDGTYNPRGDVTRGQLASFVTRSIERATGETTEVGDADFPDVGGPNSAHGQAIRKLANAGIVRSYEDGNFRPSDSVSRDQAARYVSGALEHLLGEPLPTSGAGFSDVAPGSQYAPDIDQMVTAGILDGYPDGTFRPREPISRGQMAKLIANAIQVSADGGDWAG